MAPNAPQGVLEALLAAQPGAGPAQGAGVGQAFFNTPLATPPPNNALETFGRSLAAGVVAPIVSFPAGVMDLASQMMPGFQATGGAAEVQEGVKNAFGVGEGYEDLNQSPIAGAIGEGLGLLVGALLPAAGTARAAAGALAKVPQFLTLAQKAPLVARAIQATIETAAFEAATAEPDARNIMLWSAVDIGARSWAMRKGFWNKLWNNADKYYPVWSVAENRWSTFKDLAKDTQGAITAIRSLAKAAGASEDEVMHALVAPEIARSMENMLDSSKVNVIESNAASKVTLRFLRDQRLISIDSQDTAGLLEISERVLSGDIVDQIVGSPGQIKALREVLTVQTPDEIDTLWKLAHARLSGKEPAGREGLTAKVKNHYAVVESTDGNTQQLVPITKLAHDFATKIRAGEARVVDFLLARSWPTKQEEVISNAISAIWGKRYNWELPTTFLKENPRSKAPMISIRYAPLQKSGESATITFKLNEDGSMPNELVKLLAEHPEATPVTVTVPALNDTRMRHTVADGWKRVKKGAEKKAGEAGAAGVEGAGQAGVEVAEGTVGTAGRVAGAVTAAKPDDMTGAVDAFRLAEADREPFRTGTTSTETHQRFIESTMPAIERKLGLDVLPEDSLKRRAWLSLRSAVQQRLISPLNYVLSATLIRNLPDEIFKATKLSLFVEEGMIEAGGAVAFGHTFWGPGGGETLVRLARGASVDTLAHELVHATLSVFKPEHQRKLLTAIAKEIDLNSTGELRRYIERLAGGVIGDSAEASEEQLVQFIGQYFLNRHVYGKLSKDAISGTVWDRFRATMKAVWNGVMNITRLSGQQTTEHRVVSQAFDALDDVFKDILPEIDNTRYTMKLGSLRFRGMPDRDAVQRISADIGHLLNLEIPGSAHFLRQEGRIYFPKQQDVPDYLWETQVANRLKAVLGIDDAIVKEITPSVGLPYRGLVNPDGVIIPIEIDALKRSVRVRAGMKDFLTAWAEPTHFDFDPDSFMKSLEKTYGKTYADEWLRAVKGDKSVPDPDSFVGALQHRLAKLVGITQNLAARVKIIADGNGVFRFVGEGLDDLRAALRAAHWTEQDAIYGFSPLGHSDHRRLFATMQHESTDVAFDKTLSVIVDPALGRDTIRVKFKNGSSQDYDLGGKPFTINMQEVTEVRAKSLDQVAAGIGRNSGGRNAPLTLIRNAEHPDGLVTVYLRPGGKISGDADMVVRVPEILGKLGEGKDAFHPELRELLELGYKIQGIEAREIPDVWRIQRAYADNIDVLKLANYESSPAALAGLRKIGQQKGYQVFYDPERIVISRSGTERASFTDGKKALDWLLLQSDEIPDLGLDPAVYRALEAEIEGMRVKAGVKEAEATYHHGDPVQGVWEQIFSKKTMAQTVQAVNVLWSALTTPLDSLVQLLDRIGLQKEGVPALGLYRIHRMLREVGPEVGTLAAAASKEAREAVRGLSEESRVRVSTALAHYVGMSEEYLASSPGRKAIQREYLKHVTLTAEEMKGVRTAVEFFESLYPVANDVFQTYGGSEGREDLMHLTSYLRKKMKFEGMPYWDSARLTTVQRLGTPGFTKLRRITQNIAPGQELDILKLMSGYAYDVYRAQKFTPVQKEIEKAAELLRGVPHTLEFRDWQVAADRVLHQMQTLLTGQHAMPTTFSQVAIHSLFDHLMGNPGGRVKATVEFLTPLVYLSTMGFRTSVAARNLVAQPLMTIPVIGLKHWRNGITMAKEFAHGDWHEFATKQAMPFLEEFEKADREFLRDRFGHRGKAWETFYETAMLPMRYSEKWNRVATFLGGVSYADEVVALARSKGARSAEVITGTALSHFDEGARTLLLEALESAVKSEGAVNAFRSKFASELVRATQFEYGAVNSFLPGTTWIGKVLGQFATWPTNYVNYLRRGMLNFQANVPFSQRITPYGRKFITRWAAVHGIAAGTFASIGLYQGNSFFFGPAEYTGGPLLQIGADLYDSIRLGDQESRIAKARAQRGITNLMFQPAALRDVIKITQDLGDGEAQNALLHLVGTPQEEVGHNPHK